jgi:hypothetical protein
MLLGQVVAISVASNLFFAAVVLRRASSLERDSKQPPSIRGRRPQALVPPGAYIPILLSHLTVMISPTVAHPSSNWFLPNLLTMHLLIVLPLLMTPSENATPNPNPSSMSAQTLYLLLAALALVPRAQTYRSLAVLDQSFSGLAQGLWATLHEHAAQSSIGYDVVWTTASFAGYCAIAGLDLAVSKGALGVVSPGLALYLDDQQE